jgi:polysaccharide biosynthesis protein PslH
VRILLVTPFLPYPGVPHAGGKLVYRLLSTLSGRHGVWLVSRRFPGEEARVPELKGMVRGLETVPADGPAREGSPGSVARAALSYVRLARATESVLARERFDLCQAEFTETGVFWSPPKGIPSVLTCHDIIAKPAYRRYASSDGMSKGFAWLSWKAKAMAEKSAVSRFRRIVTLSEEDREWAGRLYPEAVCRVLPYPAGIGFLGLPHREIPGRILFVGALHRPSNEEAVAHFLEHVWPTVRERHEDAEFCVVGGGMSGRLRALLCGDPRIRATGRVERVEEHYRTASVFVAPILFGGGIIVKILDAMAAGVPVVTTRYGNEGIRACEGEEILVAEGPADFSRCVLRLLEDADLRSCVGAAGRRFVERNFSSERFGAALEGIYSELVPGAPAASEAGAP